MPSNPTNQAKEAAYAKAVRNRLRAIHARAPGSSSSSADAAVDGLLLADVKRLEAARPGATQRMLFPTPKQKKKAQYLVRNVSTTTSVRAAKQYFTALADTGT